MQRSELLLENCSPAGGAILGVIVVGPVAIFGIVCLCALFLKGQPYFPVNEEMPWPSTEFEIVRTYPGDRWVGIFCHGEKLVPVRTVELSVCQEEVVWAEREEVADGDPESFVKSLLAT